MIEAPAVDDLISLIIPCYNEEDVIEMCHRRISTALEGLSQRFEIIYVNDGSRDQTLPRLYALREADPRIVVVSLSRNFGKEAAMTAGLDRARGAAVIILDADLQDPPELIPDLIAVWRDENADVVYGQRTSREGESWLKKATAGWFYDFINFISDVPIPKNAGDFRLMSRRAVDALSEVREHHRFMKGLFSWIGYRQVPLHYVRKPRAAGKTKWNYLRLSNFAMEGVTGFSLVPLRIASFCGVVISIFAFLFAAWVVLRTLLFGVDVPGYASIVVLISFFSGIQLLTIGILGEYIGRIFNETKKRPLYIIDQENSRL